MPALAKLIINFAYDQSEQLILAAGGYIHSDTSSFYFCFCSQTVFFQPTAHSQQLTAAFSLALCECESMSRASVCRHRTLLFLASQLVHVLHYCLPQIAVCCATESTQIKVSQLQWRAKPLYNNNKLHFMPLLLS